MIDSIVETGESTLFVGWQTKTKVVRRPQTIEEQLLNPEYTGFVVEEQTFYDNAKVKFIKPEDFVFDKITTIIGIIAQKFIELILQSTTSFQIKQTICLPMKRLRI